MQRCLIVLGFEESGDMGYEGAEGSPSISSDEELSPTNNSWSKEFEVPDGTPDAVIAKVGQGYAFMADWTAQDTRTIVYKEVDGEWKPI